MFGLEHSFQFFVYLKSIGIGFICGVLLEINDAALISNKILKAISDFFALVLCGIISFMFCYAVNFGIARFYILAGEVTGYLVFRLTFGSVNRKAIKKLKNKFKTEKKYCIKQNNCCIMK